MPVVPSSCPQSWGVGIIVSWENADSRCGAGQRAPLHSQHREYGVDRKGHQFLFPQNGFPSNKAGPHPMSASTKTTLAASRRSSPTNVGRLVANVPRCECCLLSVGPGVASKRSIRSLIGSPSRTRCCAALNWANCGPPTACCQTFASALARASGRWVAPTARSSQASYFSCWSWR